MRRSAISASLSVVALLLASACGPPESGEASAKAHAAWKLYLSEPGPGSYENFIRANRAAANTHAMPHDRAGIEYQLRALEVEAAEAERTGDAALAETVAERLDEIDRRDLAGVYDENLPGAKPRLAAVRSRVAPLIR